MFGFMLPPQRALLLTQEESLALLEMCAFTLAPDRQVHASILSRIGEFCRTFQQGDSSAMARSHDEGEDRYRGAVVRAGLHPEPAG